MYGTVRTVVWEDGGGNPASYPINSSAYAQLTRRVLPGPEQRQVGEYLLPDVEPEAPPDQDRPGAADYFLALKSVSAQHNADLLVVALCFDDSGLASFLRSNGIGFLPIPCRREWFFEHDRHFNELGHDSVASIIAEPVLWKIGQQKDHAGEASGR